MCERGYDKQHMTSVTERKNHCAVSDDVKMLNEDKTMLIEIDVMHPLPSLLKQLCSLMNMIANFDSFLSQ